MSGRRRRLRREFRREPEARFGQGGRSRSERTGERLRAGMTILAIAFVVVGLRLAEVSLFREPESQSGQRPRTSPHTRRNSGSNGDHLGDHGFGSVRLAESFRCAGSRPARNGSRRTLPRSRPGCPGKNGSQPASASERQFMWVRRHVSATHAAAAMRLGSPSLAIREETRRVYPQGRTYFPCGRLRQH